MKRFEKVFSQGTMDVVEIWVDTETCLNNLWHKSANAAGLTPLMDENRNPVVTRH